MKLLILDGNSVINRAYFGVKPLTTRDGLYTHAIYGFLNILERMEKEEQPEAVCVAFDLHGPTFRHLKYEGYKATRHAMPEELVQQMPIMKDVLRAMNIPIYECQGWEADDVIGTVGKICSQQDWECVIVTGDVTQIDLPFIKKSGLIEAVDILDGIDGIAIFHFTHKDVVRHPLVQRIILAYEKNQKQRAQTPARTFKRK